jgi:hypothetical protein
VILNHKVEGNCLGKLMIRAQAVQGWQQLLVAPASSCSCPQHTHRERWVGEWRRERKRQTQRKGFGFSPCTVYDAEIHMIVVSHCYWSFPCNFRPFQFYNVCPVFLGVLLLLLLAAPSRSSATQTVTVIYHTFFSEKKQPALGCSY